METFGANEFVRWEFDQGVLKLELKPYTLLDLTVAQHIDCLLSGLVEGGLCLILWDLSGISGSDKAGRDYFSRHCMSAKATAVYAGTAVSLTIARFILRRCKPSVPTQVFTDSTEALQYLRHQ